VNFLLTGKTSIGWKPTEEVKTGNLTKERGGRQRGQDRATGDMVRGHPENRFLDRGVQNRVKTKNCKNTSDYQKVFRKKEAERGRGGGGGGSDTRGPKIDSKKELSERKGTIADNELVEESRKHRAGRTAHLLAHPDWGRESEHESRKRNIRVGRGLQKRPEEGDQRPLLKRARRLSKKQK